MKAENGGIKGGRRGMYYRCEQCKRTYNKRPIPVEQVKMAGS